MLVIVILAVINTLPDDTSSQKHCTDSDGRNPFVVGDTFDWRSGYSFQDRCVDSKTAYEYYCEYPATDLRGKTKIEMVSCKHGCVAGSCGTPDLVLKEMMISRQPTTSDEFKVNFRIVNNGNIDASVVDIEAYVEPCYAILIEPPRVPLKPGYTTDATYSVTCKVPGTFRFTSVLDPFDVLQESNEGNNMRTDVVMVRGFDE